MDRHAGGANDGEGDEAQGHEAAERLVQQQSEEFEQHQRVELAFPVLAGAEAVGQLADAQLPLGRNEKVQQDLEAGRRQAWRYFLEERPRQHEEAAHGIGDGFGQHGTGKRAAEVGHGAADRRQAPGGVAPLRVAASDHDVRGPVQQQGDHPGKERLVVLQVAVDHGDEVGRGGERAFDASGGEAATADATDAAHARVGRRDPPGDGGGSIGAVVVHEHDFPGDARERPVQPIHHDRNVAGFVEAGHHDGEFAGGRRRGRARGNSRPDGGIDIDHAVLTSRAVPGFPTTARKM